MQDQNGDHDLIPDEWQEPGGPREEQSLAKARGDDEHDFGQWEAPPKKQTFEKPKKTDWTPIDLSHGTFKHPELFQSRQRLRSNLMKDLKPTLQKFSQRRAVTDMLLKKREHGLGRLEVKKGLRELKKQGLLKDFQVRKLRRQFGAF